MKGEIIAGHVRQPSKKTGVGKHKAEALGPELYPTPREVTEALLSVERLPHRIWEPAAGIGSMSAVLAERGHAVFASDITDYGLLEHGSPNIQAGIDFTKLNPDRLRFLVNKPDAIVTNPPFSQAEDFVRVGLKIAPKVCILARLAFLEGSARSDIIDGHLTRVHVFANRLPMMHRWVPGPDGRYREWPGKKAGSAMAFAWFIFEERKDGPTHLHRLRWLKSKQTTQ